MATVQGEVFTNYTSIESSNMASGDISYFCPFNVYYQDSRMQYVIPAAQLTGIGFKSGDKITEIRFKIAYVPTGNVPNFRMALKNVGYTNFAGKSNFETYNTLKEVISATTIPKTNLAVDAWYSCIFPSGFIWDGTNLLVDISKDGTTYVDAGAFYVRNSSISNAVIGTFHDSSTSFPYETTVSKTFSQYIPQTIVVGEQGTGSPTGTAYTKTLSDSMSFTESLLKVSAKNKKLSDAINFTESLSKISAINKILTENIVSTDSYIKQYLKIISLTDSVSILDTLSIQNSHVFTKLLYDTASFTDFLSKNNAINLIENIIANETINKKFIKSILDNIMNTELFYKKNNKKVFDTILQNDSLNKQLTLAVIDNVALNESEKENTNKMLFDSVTNLDNLSKKFLDNIFDNINISDGLINSGNKYTNLNEYIVISDMISKSLSIKKNDVINSNEVESEFINKKMSDSINQSDSISSTKGKAKNMLDNIIIIDAISKSLTKYKYDNVLTTENETDNINKKMLDSITQTDILSFSYGKNIILTDNINSNDIPTRELLNKKILDFISVNDTKNKITNINLYDIIITVDKLETYLPDAPQLIGIIKLKGKLDLNVYLLGKQVSNVYLLGKQVLKINLKGDINMTMENQNFEMYSGESKNLLVEMVSATDFNGSNAIWELKKSKFSKENILEKKNPDILLNNNIVTVPLKPSDTENINGYYFYKLKIIDQNDNVSIITTGTITII